MNREELNRRNREKYASLTPEQRANYSNKKRLEITKSCEKCGQAFHPRREVQSYCSRACYVSATKRWEYLPVTPEEPTEETKERQARAVARAILRCRRTSYAPILASLELPQTVPAAAAKLGLSEEQLRYLIKKYGRKNPARILAGPRQHRRYVRVPVAKTAETANSSLNAVGIAG